MRQVPRQRQRLLAPFQGLLGKAKEPEAKSGLRPTDHAGVLPINIGQGGVLVAVVEADHLIKLAESRRMLSERRQRDAHRMMRQQEESVVVRGLRYTLTPRRQSPRGFVLGSRGVEDPKSPKDGKKLGREAG